MDFELDEEQRILQKTASTFLKKECPRELVRRLDESDDGHSPELWAKMAGLGWMGLFLPEEYGGVDLSFLHMAVLLEEMGFNICPSPFICTTLLGCLPFLLLGSEQQKAEYLPRVARGDLILTMALAESDSGSQPCAIKLKAVQEDGSWVLDGIKLFVPYALAADYILCVARTGEHADPAKGITLFLVKRNTRGMRVTPLKTVSRDRLCEVAFDSVLIEPANVIGAHGQAWPVIEQVLNIAAVARCAEVVGAMRAVLDMTVAYTGQRVQFGHPIGSYQAIQHYLADMWVDLLGTRNLVLKAASRVATGRFDHSAISMAKVRTGNLGRKATSVAHHIFGAIGFTMEHDLHLYHRRTLGADLAFGDPDFHYAQIARGLGL